MFRGVWIFLLFILAVSGWGFWFYSQTVERQDIFEVESVQTDYASESANETEASGSTAQDFVALDSPAAKEAQEQSDVDARIMELEAQKKQLTEEYQKLASRVSAIEADYKSIQKENEELKKKLGLKDERLNTLNSTVTQLKRKNTQLTMQVQRLSGEIKALRLENKVLKTRIQQLRDILNSWPKLKQAIRDLKIRMRLERKRKREEARRRALANGNRGYVVRNGRPTIGANKVQGANVIERLKTRSKQPLKQKGGNPSTGVNANEKVSVEVLPVLE